MAPPRTRPGADGVVAIGFSVPPPYREAIEAQAAKRDISKSELFRRMVEVLGWVDAPPEAEPLRAKAIEFAGPDGQVVATGAVQPPPSRPGYRRVQGLKPPAKGGQ